jgi:predicted aldo/keto reductase-like oxidoreductase
MRLPTIGGDSSKIDEASATGMLSAAVEAGVNYVDTAWPYHKEQSESWLGRAVEALGVRDKVYIATKAPSWLIKESADWERYLSAQLVKLRTDHIDFYLIHALTSGRWKTVLQTGGLEFLAKAKADGRIGHAGFSFHDSLPSFKEIIDGWRECEFCQVQYNYFDEDYQAGAAGIEYAAARGIGAIVMEPLRGGSLARVPDEVKRIFSGYGTPRMPAEWALRHVLDRQEAVTVLSGMGSSDQLWENAAVASSAKPNAMGAAERAVVAKARAFFASRMAVPCTGCGYCQPCPSGVAIQDVFGLWNEASMFGTLAECSGQYRADYAAKGSGAGACVECGACLPKCPQGIDIPARLSGADEALGPRPRS